MRIDQHRLFDDDGRAIEFRESPNHGGKLKPRYLVMHYTAGRSCDHSARWLCEPRAKASAHVVIGRDGKVLQLVGFDRVAWHAGASRWKDGGRQLIGLNRHSIGIELDNPGKLVRRGDKYRSLSLGLEFTDADVIVATHKLDREPAAWHVYPEAQLEVAFEVASLLVQEYGLRDVLGHDDIAPLRKRDPGPAFPMESFRSRLFGRAEDR